jgi:predicted DNA binding CopG/RHH family protein
MMKYDDYEKDLLDREDEILSLAKTPTNKEKALLQEAARNTMNKDKRINIRISSRDLGSLQRRANRYGMPYQTLISSVLHRYISGDLKEKAFESDSPDR